MIAINTLASQTQILLKKVISRGPNHTKELKKLRGENQGLTKNMANLLAKDDKLQKINEVLDFKLKQQHKEEHKAKRKLKTR